MAENMQWKPMEGDSVAGTVREIRNATSSYGPFHVLTLENTSGLIDVACFGVSLTQLGNQAAVGDEITIEYVGERKAKSGRMYKHFERTLNDVSI